MGAQPCAAGQRENRDDGEKERLANRAEVTRWQGRVSKPIVMFALA
jgi:hypothetical protein